MENKRPTTTETSKTDNRTKKKKSILIVVLVVVLIVLILLFFSKWLINNGTSDTSTTPTKTPTATPNVLYDNREGVDGTYQFSSREEILQSLENNQQIVTDTISSNATFSSGKKGTIGDWVLENIEDNSVIQQAEIYSCEDDLMLVQTEPLYSGQYIKAVELLTDLESGEHEVIAYINYYNEDDKTFIGKAAYRINLTVK